MFYDRATSGPLNDSLLLNFAHADFEEVLYSCAFVIIEHYISVHVTFPEILS